MLKKYSRTSIYIVVAIFCILGVLAILYARSDVHPVKAVLDTPLSSPDAFKISNNKVNFSNPRRAEQYSFTYIKADTETLRQKGLSGRTRLDDKETMLFVFENSDIHFFWMKNMLFPIDIVWLDSGKKVVHIEHRVAPETYPKSFGPTTDSLYVLEFNAGTAKSIDLQVGDSVVF